MAETSPPDTRVVLSTAPDEATATTLAERLLSEALIACANVVPGVRSIYRWEGEVRRDDEVLMVLKTTATAVPRLVERVQALHPYDMPEVVVLPVVDGAAAYLGWVRDEVRATDA